VHCSYGTLFVATYDILSACPNMKTPLAPRAERIFKAREYQKADAPKATAEYYAAQQRLRESSPRSPHIGSFEIAFRVVVQQV